MKSLQYCQIDSKRGCQRLRWIGFVLWADQAVYDFMEVKERAYVILSSVFVLRRKHDIISYLASREGA